MIIANSYFKKQENAVPKHTRRGQFDNVNYELVHVGFDLHFLLK